MKKNGFNILILLVALTGCSTSGIEAIGKPSAENDQKHLVVHNESLAGKVTISSMNSRIRGSLMEVNATLSNLTSRDKRIQYRFAWFDKEGFEVERESTSWTPVVLHGAAEITLRDVAPNPAADSYKINVREQ